MNEQKLNGKLAILRLIGGAAYSFSTFFVSFLTARFLGTDAILAVSIGGRVLNLLGILVSACVFIAIFIPGRHMTYIACGINLAIALACTLVPDPLIRLFNDNSNIAYVARYIKMTGLIILVMSGICILFGVLCHRKSTILYLLIAATAAIYTVVLPLFLIPVFGLGFLGAAMVHAMQPIAAVLPFLFANWEKDNPQEAEKSPLQEDPELYQNSKWSKY